jgi:hypothetical protein
MRGENKGVLEGEEYSLALSSLAIGDTVVCVHRHNSHPPHCKYPLFPVCSPKPGKIFRNLKSALKLIEVTCC